MMPNLAFGELLILSNLGDLVGKGCGRESADLVTPNSIPLQWRWQEVVRASRNIKIISTSGTAAADRGGFGVHLLFLGYAAGSPPGMMVLNPWSADFELIAAGLAFRFWISICSTG